MRPDHPLIKFFNSSHLINGDAERITHKFRNVACELDRILPDGAEKTVALRKLLEAQDAANRSLLNLE